jgi:exonuclease III
LVALVEAERPDVLAISEHKLATAKVDAAKEELVALVPGYTAHFAVCTAKNGYSGVLALVRDGLEVSVAVDTVCASLHEGRTLTITLPQCHAVMAYVPNSGQKLERLDYRIETWECVRHACDEHAHAHPTGATAACTAGVALCETAPERVCVLWPRRPAMREHLKELEKSKPLVLLGDLNVAHLDTDIWNVSAKHIVKSAGCTPRERAAFGELLADGYVDSFRHLHPDATGCFSYWSTRSGAPNHRQPVSLCICARIDQCYTSCRTARQPAPQSWPPT